MNTPTPNLTQHLVQQIDFHWTSQLRPRLDGLSTQEYLHINRELIHHGAEIALLRDLYAHRAG